MAQIKLRFLTQGDWVSRIIRELTDCIYSHVEFVMDDEWTGELQRQSLFGLLCGGPSQWTLGAHLDHGIEPRQINYAAFTAQETLVVECSDEQKAAVVKAALACVGAPYDIADIAGILLRRNWTEHGRFICSVFVTKVLVEAGIGVLRIAPEYAPSVTPRDVFLSPLLKAA